MSFFRPEAMAALYRWREVIAAGGAAAFGLWLIALGGLILTALGAAAVAAALGLGLTALRRMRFARRPEGPGVVEIVEGQIAWYGPGIGGFVALDDLRALSLVTVAGMRCWRLDQADGAHLLIPVGAAGAERLFDAFAALPGLDAADLPRALEAAGTGARLVWQRRAAPMLAGPHAR
ncbi:MAG: hypothetical protein ACK4OP_02770 [Gemmobacter sp.]